MMLRQHDHHHDRQRSAAVPTYETDQGLGGSTLVGGAAVRGAIVTPQLHPLLCAEPRRKSPPCSDRVSGDQCARAALLSCLLVPRAVRAELQPVARALC